MPTWTELEMFLSARERPFRLREDAALEHIHWAGARVRTYDELTVLAMDHRSQFEELCQRVGADPECIPAFKALALRAVDRRAKGDPRFGPAEPAGAATATSTGRLPQDGPRTAGRDHHIAKWSS